MTLESAGEADRCRNSCGGGGGGPTSCLEVRGVCGS